MDRSDAAGAGDYNLDGTVDAADYEVWRSDFGNSTQVSPLVRGDGTVDAADYAIWRDRLGQSWPSLGGGSESAAAVPEPASALLMACAVGGFALVSRRHA